MNLRPLSRDEVREMDRRAIQQFGIPGVILMENAGRGAADWLMELGIGGQVLVCSGKGNNGGDGYVIARHLEAAGYSVHVLIVCDPVEVSGDALVNLQILRAAGTPVTRWETTRHDPAVDDLFGGAAWIVDGLLGTGVQGDVRQPIRSAIEIINSSAARRFAIDIPSGLDGDTGRPLGVAVRASHTATFVATKLGFSNPESVAFVGKLKVVDIGLPHSLLREYLLS